MKNPFTLGGNITIEKESNNIIFRYYGKVAANEFENRINLEIDDAIRQEIELIVARDLRPIITRIVAEALGKKRL